MATRKRPAEEINIQEISASPKVKVIHALITITAEANITGGMSASEADARVSARLAEGYKIVHVDSRPYIDNATREELGTRVFYILIKE